MLSCGKVRPAIAVGRAPRLPLRLRALAVAARPAQRAQDASTALAGAPLGWGALLAAARPSRRHASTPLPAKRDRLEGVAEGKAEKAGKDAKKAEKKARKAAQADADANAPEVDAPTEDCGGKEDKESKGGKKNKKKKKDMAAAAGVEKTLEAGVVGAMTQVVEMQVEMHTRQVDAWEQERKSFREREAQLMQLVDSLTQQVVALSSAPPSASASAATPPPPPSAPEAPATPPSAAEPKSVLGGDGVNDILKLIQEHNKKFESYRDEDEEEVEDVMEEPPPANPVPLELNPAAAAAPEAEVVDSSNNEPVTLKLWDDDIYWVNQLQAALLREGLYCGEEEMEEWYFGHHTETALLTWQAMKGLPETGVCDLESWAKLLGPGFRRVEAAEMPPEVQPAGAGDAGEAGAGRAGAAATKDVFAFLKEEKKPAESGGDGAKAPAPPGAGSTDSEEVRFEKWPILRLDEGGAAVHHCHVALEKHGFGCDEDEQRWWMYGDATQAAVMTFQACSGLADTGMVDEHTWKALMGNPDAVPNDIAGLTSDDSFDEDLSSGNGSRVWLVGEQRWSN